MDWHKSSLTIAEKQTSLSQYQLENRKAAQQISQLNSKILGYGTQISDLNAQQKYLNDTISNQQTLIDNIKHDVDNANLQGISTKLEDLSDSVDDLGTQISNLNFVTPLDFTNYQTNQKEITDDLTERIEKLEGGNNV